MYSRQIAASSDSNTEPNGLKTNLIQITRAFTQYLYGALSERLVILVQVLPSKKTDSTALLPIMHAIDYLSLESSIEYQINLDPLFPASNMICEIK